MTAPGLVQVNSAADLERLQLYQAAALSLFFVVFAAVYRDRRPQLASVRAAPHAQRDPAPALLAASLRPGSGPSHAGPAGAA